MKFRGHETFSIRKGWLNKGLRNVINKPDVFICKTENPMDILGIGSNMVKSLRYWLQATNLTYEPRTVKRFQQLTEIGNIIYQNDPYFEEIGTLWLIHYALATNEKEATSWYIFFNELDLAEFTEEDFEKKLNNYIKMNYPEETIPSKRVISDDFKCVINTYYSKRKVSSGKNDVNPEDNLECPLTELGLVDFVSLKHGERVYRKSVSKKENIPDLIILAMILYKYEDIKEIRISSLQNDVNSIGKICCLDTITLHDILYNLDVSGYLKVVRTAGLDIIRITTDMKYADCVRLYYQELNDRQELKS